MHSAENEFQLLTTTDTKFKLVIQIVWRLFVFLRVRFLL